MLVKACRSKTPDIDQVRSYLDQNTCDVNMREGDEVVNNNYDLRAY